MDADEVQERAYATKCNPDGVGIGARGASAIHTHGPPAGSGSLVVCADAPGSGERRGPERRVARSGGIEPEDES